LHRSNLSTAKARELHETRTSLVKAETIKTHLEQRVEEFSRQQKGDVERLAVYERRSSAVNGASAEGGSREQQLESEVTDLRYVACDAIPCNVLTLIASTSLNIAEVDLAAARNHIQQFKEISQASEEALASLNMTHDEYKSTTEAQLTASYVCPLRSCVYFMGY
jgi:nucleoprotein TPR